MSKKELMRRYLVFFLSIFFISLGVSSTVCSQLGTSPVSCAPYVFSVNTPFTIGTYLFFLNVLLIAIQMIILGAKGVMKNKMDLLLQLPISVLFGLCTDFNMWLLSDLSPVSYPAKMATLLIGCVILGFGISLEIKANVAMMSGEYTLQLSSKRFNMEFSTLKILFDSFLVVVALISSLLFTSTIVGIGEGTIITALITGLLVKLIIPQIDFIGKWMEDSTEIIEEAYN